MGMLCLFWTFMMYLGPPLRHLVPHDKFKNLAPLIVSL